MPVVDMDVEVAVEVDSWWETCHVSVIHAVTVLGASNCVGCESGGWIDLRALRRDVERNP